MSDNTDYYIADRTAAVREGAGLSQAALASVMRRHGHPKWSQATVWSVEAGKRPLRFSEAITLARIAGIEVSDLTPWSPLPSPSDPSADYLLDKIQRSVDRLRKIEEDRRG